MRSRYLALLFTAVFGALACAASPAILPAPQLVQEEGGMRELPRQILAEERFRPQATALGHALEAVTGLSISIVAGDRDEDAIRFALTEGLPEEAYRIDTRKGIVLEASKPAGMARATATLLQLSDKGADGRWQLPRVVIEDAPDHPFRGFLVDMARNPHSPEVLRRVIDMMWLAKANYLQVHLTDDHMISWPSTAFPELLSTEAGWTLADWREIEAYSQARGVTIIPELEVPAHSLQLRTIYPEVFGKTPAELATSESAFQGITTLLDEMMDVFQATPYIHIGADEAAEVSEEDQRNLINRLNRFLKTRGRQTLVWEGPPIGRGDNKVDEDVIHLNWRAIDVPPREMLAAGYRIINASWDPLYIVDHYARDRFTMVPSELCYQLDLQQFKHVHPRFRTYETPERIEATDKLLGFCMPWWEGRQENLFPMCRQRLTAATARAWNDTGETSFDSFLTRDAKLEALLETLRPWQGGEPTAGWADRQAAPTPGNLAHGKPVHISTGASQPHFGPQRLTNGATDRFDHFLGYPCLPEPLEITIDLEAVHPIGRIEVFESAQPGHSPAPTWEEYELAVSRDRQSFESIGKTEQSSRGQTHKVVFLFDPREARYIRIRTRGCKGFRFDNFSRLCEVMAFEARR